MEIFVTAAQGAGKSTLARKIAMEHTLLTKDGKPTRITEVSVYGASLERDIAGSHIVIFEDIHKQTQLDAARAFYALQARKPLCIYVTSSHLRVSLI